GIRDRNVTGVQTCALPILPGNEKRSPVDIAADFLKRIVLKNMVSRFIRLDNIRRIPVNLDRIFPDFIQGEIRFSGGPALMTFARSEERRVGNEGRAREWAW